MKALNKFQDLSVEELKATYMDLSRDLFRLKNELRLLHKVEKPHVIKQKKRDRARVLTALRAKDGTLN